MSEIWAVLEQKEGSLQEQSGELLAALHEIAQRQPEPATLCAVLLTGQDTLSAGPLHPDSSPGYCATHQVGCATTLSARTSIAGLLHH